MKCIFIVDPQIDFITGSLPVPGAAAAMAELSEWLNNNHYDLKIVTLDFHPYDHLSFQDHGGQWPIHCVAHTQGAAIWPELARVIYGREGETRIFCKGSDKNREEYSIFQNSEAANAIKKIINNDVSQIDICGIAGDVCVLNTLKDGLKIFGPQKFNLLERFSPSIDGGAALHTFWQERQCTR